MAGQDGRINCNRGDNRFPTADIPLQQPVHLKGTAQITANFINHPLLRRRQLKGNRLNEGPQFLVVIPDLQAIRRPAGQAHRLQPQLKQKDLFVSRGPPGLLGLFPGGGKM